MKYQWNVRISLQVALFVMLVPAMAQTAGGDVERGKQLYFDHACYSCHGYQGVGRRKLADDASGIMANEQVFLSYLRARADQNPVLPAQNMPNYAKESLPDADALDIYAYIRTFKDDAPAVEDIPLLETILEEKEEAAGEQF